MFCQSVSLTSDEYMYIVILYDCLHDLSSNRPKVGVDNTYRTNDCNRQVFWYLSFVVVISNYDFTPNFVFKLVFMVNVPGQIIVSNKKNLGSEAIVGIK